MPDSLQFRSARTPFMAIAEYVMPANFNVPSHEHTPPHVLVMLAGSLVEKHNDGLQECVARSIRYSPGGDAHSQIRVGAQGAHCLVVEAPAFPELRLLEREYVPADDACKEVDELAQCLVHDGSVSPACVEEKTLQLFSLVRARSRLAHTQHQHWVSTIPPFLNTLQHSQSPLADAATRVNRNSSIVSRLFRASYGVTVQRYYRRRQLDRAWDMIVNSRTPFSAIASDCDFTDQSHLTRALKREAGTSPARLRNRIADGDVIARHWYQSFLLQTHTDH